MTDIRFHILLRERHFTILSLLFTFYKVSEFIFRKGQANFLKSFFRIIIKLSLLLSQDSRNSLVSLSAMIEKSKLMRGSIFEFIN
jgi:hypothetical protein